MNQPPADIAAAPPPAPDTFVAFLMSVAAAVPPESIDQLWIFPPRTAGKMRSLVAVIAAFESDEPERRRVITAHRVTKSDEKGRVQTVDSVEEQATAPVDRVERVVDGVLRRLAEETVDAPRHVALAGDPEAWTSLLDDLAAGS